MATVMFDTGKKDYTAEVSSLITQIETTVNDTGISLKTCTFISAYSNLFRTLNRDR